jgi:hypothetical protein
MHFIHPPVGGPTANRVGHPPDHNTLAASLLLLKSHLADTSTYEVLEISLTGRLGLARPYGRSTQSSNYVMAPLAILNMLLQQESQDLPGKRSIRYLHDIRHDIRHYIRIS